MAHKKKLLQIDLKLMVAEFSRLLPQIIIIITVN